MGIKYSKDNRADILYDRKDELQLSRISNKYAL